MARQNDRASTFKMVLSCFSQIFECLSPTPSNGKPALKTGTKNVEQLTRMDLDERSKEHCRFVFELFAAINDEDPSIFTDEVVTRVMSFSPLELVAVCCLLSRWGRERPQGMLAGDIVLLRKKLREAYHDLRLNGTCWKTCWDYIDNLERYRGTIDQSTKNKARSDAAKSKQAPQRKGSTSAPKPKGPSMGTFEAPAQAPNTTQVAPHQAVSPGTIMQPPPSNTVENAQPAFTSINGGNSTPLAARQPLPDNYANRPDLSHSRNTMPPPASAKAVHKPVIPDNQETRQSSQVISTDDEDAQRQLILAQFQASKALRASQGHSTPTNGQAQALAPVQIIGQQSVSATPVPPSRKRGGFDSEGDPRMATRIKQESQ